MLWKSRVENSGGYNGHKIKDISFEASELGKNTATMTITFDLGRGAIGVSEIAQPSEITKLKEIIADIPEAAISKINSQQYILGNGTSSSRSHIVELKAVRIDSDRQKIDDFMDKSSDIKTDIDVQRLMLITALNRGGMLSDRLTKKFIANEKSPDDGYKPQLALAKLMTLLSNNITKSNER